MQTRAVVVRKDENGQRVYELRESVRSAGENWHCYSYVMFRDRTCSTESELRMSKIWSDLCIFIGSYPWSTAEQKHRLRHHHHSISLCILKKNSMVLRSAIDQRIRQIEMSQNISNILCWSCRPFFSHQLGVCLFWKICFIYFLVWVPNTRWK